MTWIRQFSPENRMKNANHGRHHCLLQELLQVDPARHLKLMHEQIMTIDRNLHLPKVIPNNRQSSFSSLPADDRSNASQSGSHSPARSDNSRSGSSTLTFVTRSLNSRSGSMDSVRSGSSGSPPVGQADKPEPSKEDLTGDETSPNEILHIKTSKMVINLNKYFISNK
jgi:hypothetical protein